MKKIIIFIASFILVVIIGALILYMNTFPLARPIELPEVNEVHTVEITEEISTKKYTDHKEILEILNCFLNAKPTRIMSVNETPNVRKLYTVNFFSKEDRLYTSYIYNKNSKWYIEQPYYGVYEIKENLLDFLP